jgi:hypothetical protein
MGGVALDAHTASTSVALLAAPELVIQKRLVYGDTGRKTTEQGDKRFAMAFAGCRETKHRDSIIKVIDRRFGMPRGTASGNRISKADLSAFSGPPPGLPAGLG